MEPTRLLAENARRASPGRLDGVRPDREDAQGGLAVGFEALESLAFALEQLRDREGPGVPTSSQITFGGKPST